MGNKTDEELHALLKDIDSEISKTKWFGGTEYAMWTCTMVKVQRRNRIFSELMRRKELKNEKTIISR